MKLNIIIRFVCSFVLINFIDFVLAFKHYESVIAHLSNYTYKKTNLFFFLQYIMMTDINILGQLFFFVRKQLDILECSNTPIKSVNITKTY